MTTSPAPTPEDVPGNRYRCNCGWSHTVREDADGCSEDTETILLHIRIEHPEIGEKIRAEHDAAAVEPGPENPIAGATNSIRAIKYRAQRFQEFQKRADAERSALRANVVAAVALGHCSELQASKLAGVTRQTVRSWMGK